MAQIYLEMYRLWAKTFVQISSSFQNLSQFSVSVDITSQNFRQTEKKCSLLMWKVCRHRRFEATNSAHIFLSSYSFNVPSWKKKNQERKIRRIKIKTKASERTPDFHLYEYMCGICVLIWPEAATFLSISSCPSSVSSIHTCQTVFPLPFRYSIWASLSYILVDYLSPR